MLRAGSCRPWTRDSLGYKSPLALRSAKRIACFSKWKQFLVHDGSPNLLATNRTQLGVGSRKRTPAIFLSVWTAAAPGIEEIMDEVRSKITRTIPGLQVKFFSSWKTSSVTYWRAATHRDQTLLR